MNKIDDFGLFICKYVSDLFEYATTCSECSSKVFIKAYVYSSLPNIIENKNFIFESIDIPGAYNIIKKEKNIIRGKEIYPSFVMKWIGYIMTYFCYTTGIKESTFYKYIKPEEMFMLYEAYHSLDNDLVVKRIIEAKNINVNLNNVDILKSIYK
ncbi:MAG: hypothetical protein IKP77_01550 [Acholeplasmatales bacterium]|nr:hypothetical protein [Acholeplasmatales bacterium]